MSFEERLEQMNLPTMAKEFLPIDLSAKTKKTLESRPDMEQILKKAIEEINQGSVEKLDDLVARALK